MHDLDSQIRDYIDATSDPLTVDDVFHVRVGDEHVRVVTRRRPRTRWTVGLAIAGATAVSVLALLGPVQWLAHETAPTEEASEISVPPPNLEGTTESSAETSDGVSEITVPPLNLDAVTDRVPVRWEAATGAVPSPHGYGVSPIASNGSSFLGVAGGPEQGTLVRSTDGTHWEEVRPQTQVDVVYGFPFAAGEIYFRGDEAINDRCWQTQSRGACEILASDDGIEWSLRPSRLGPTPPNDWIWRTQEPSSVTDSTPPDLEPLDAYESVVMEFRDRLILLGQDHNGGSHRFAHLESTDFGTWTAIDPAPPFSGVMTDEYMNAGWQSMWRCEFTASHDRGMALIAAPGGLELWTTGDGTEWSLLPRPPGIAATPELDSCISAVEDGWIIAPGGPTGDRENPLGGGRVSGTPESILFSTDGIIWNAVEFPERFASFTGYIEVAGNSIFIFDPDSGNVIVGVINAA